MTDIPQQKSWFGMHPFITFFIIIFGIILVYLLILRDYPGTLHQHALNTPHPLNEKPVRCISDCSSELQLIPEIERNSNYIAIHPIVQIRNFFSNITIFLGAVLAFIITSFFVIRLISRRKFRHTTELIQNKMSKFFFKRGIIVDPEEFEVEPVIFGANEYFVSIERFKKLFIYDPNVNDPHIKMEIKSDKLDYQRRSYRQKFLERASKIVDEVSPV